MSDLNAYLEKRGITAEQMDERKLWPSSIRIIYAKHGKLPI